LKNKYSAVFSSLSIAAKAGKVKSGEFQTDEAIKSGRAFLVIAASDASENTRKHYRNQCDYWEIPYYEFGTKDELGRCIGKEFRSSLAIISEDLADLITKKINGLVDNGGSL